MDQPRAPVKDAAKTFLQQNTTKFIQIAKKYNLAFMKSGLGDEERTTKSLKEVSQSASAKEETPKQSAQPENTDAMEAPPTPGYRSMEDVKDLREEAVVSTDPPVENPITAQPEDKATDAVEETPKKKDSDWNAIATVGLRLLTRKAMVKLSAIGPDKPKGPGVIVSRQSFPIGNLPPVAGDTSGSSNISGSDTDFKQVEILTPPSETENPKSEETQQTESAKAAEEVTKQDEAADHAVVQDREETSKADASSQQEVDDVPRTQAAQPSTEQPALSVDQEPSAAKDSESPPDEKPKRFHVRF
ncbi:MAG: hypothetical protein LQ340_003328 [Diploschistes diacapsis]|nr:MAG: hypothetical protein LQ340_003328 [Diploschistes diacapsis]